MSTSEFMSKLASDSTLLTIEIESICLSSQLIKEVLTMNTDLNPTSCKYSAIAAHRIACPTPIAGDESTRKTNRVLDRSTIGLSRMMLLRVQNYLEETPCLNWIIVQY